MSWLTGRRASPGRRPRQSARPDCTYDCASRTASCALTAPDGSRGCARWKRDQGAAAGTCSSACWIKRSVTVGMPSSRSPPSGFGDLTRRTGIGRYVPPEPVRGCQATTCADEPRSARWTDRPHRAGPCWPSPVPLFAGSRAPRAASSSPGPVLCHHSAGRFASVAARFRQGSPCLPPDAPALAGHLMPGFLHRYASSTPLRSSFAADTATDLC